jgi:hypothetical protein
MHRRVIVDARTHVIERVNATVSADAGGAVDLVAGCPVTVAP